MPNKLITQLDSYTDLITSVTHEMRSGLARAQKALEYQRLKTYWTVGRIINAYLRRTPEAAARGTAFLKQVSEDIRHQGQLDISHDTVIRVVQFNREYSKFPSRTPLTFTHYLALMRIHDTKQRARMEARAVQEGWSALDIKREISQLLIGSNVSESGAKARKLTIERGEPYVYAVKAVEDISGDKTFRIDCGFKIERALPEGNDRIREGGRIVRAVKSDGRYTLSVCQKLRPKRYTYAARVTRVVDGDTFDACVDVGFSNWITDRFRLRGINTPELGTPEGQAAKVFVTRYMKQHPHIVIRTVKEGMYGRWLADVFALKGQSDPCLIAAQGECLNQILLDKGLAKIY